MDKYGEFTQANGNVYKGKLNLIQYLQGIGRMVKRMEKVNSNWLMVMYIKVIIINKIIIGNWKDNKKDG